MEMALADIMLSYDSYKLLFHYMNVLEQMNYLSIILSIKIISEHDPRTTVQWLMPFNHINTYTVINDYIPLIRFISRLNNSY